MHGTYRGLTPNAVDPALGLLQVGSNLVPGACNLSTACILEGWDGATSGPAIRWLSGKLSILKFSLITGVHLFSTRLK